MYGLLFKNFTQSGTILSTDQSPPPITLPARTDAKPISLLSLKKEFLYDEKIISAEAFDALYGSCPPNSSFSL